MTKLVYLYTRPFLKRVDESVALKLDIAYYSVGIHFPWGEMQHHSFHF
jgi:hypothetical protein